MPAPTLPDSLLVKFLFTAPCLLAMLTITCQREPEPASSGDRPEQVPAADPQAAATTTTANAA
jgi:hypothetical protein